MRGPKWASVLFLWEITVCGYRFPLQVGYWTKETRGLTQKWHKSSQMCSAYLILMNTEKSQKLIMAFRRSGGGLLPLLCPLLVSGTHSLLLVQSSVGPIAEGCNAGQQVHWARRVSVVTCEEGETRKQTAVTGWVSPCLHMDTDAPLCKSFPVAICRAGGFGAE